MAAAAAIDSGGDPGMRSRRRQQTAGNHPSPPSPGNAAVTHPYRATRPRRRRWGSSVVQLRPVARLWPAVGLPAAILQVTALLQIGGMWPAESVSIGPGDHLLATPQLTLLPLQPCGDPARGTFSDYIKRIAPMAVMETKSYANDKNDTKPTNATQAYNSYQFSTCPVCSKDLTAYGGREDILCNGTWATLCQLSSFAVQTNDKAEVRPLDNSAPVQIALGSPGDPATDWSCSNDVRNETGHLDGSWYTERNYSVTRMKDGPYKQQHALLSQAMQFLEAIGSMQAIFVQNKTNQTRCNSLHIPNCSTKTNEELINTVLLPVVRDLVNQSLNPVAIYTRLTYKCQMGVRDEPVITYQLGSSTDSTDEGQFRTDIELQHECACFNVSSEDCRNGYTERRDRENISKECNNLAESGRNILKWMALAVTIFIWGLEWRVTGRSASWECETLTKHPTYIFKDVLFMLGIISPINFMENRKGSLVVACMFGALAALIFQEVLAPTGDTFLDATIYLALLYPIFICRACHHTWIGYLSGAIYCVPFTFFMWLHVGCYGRTGKIAQALYFVIPALCCNVFVGWFGYQFYTRMPLLKKSSRLRAATRSSVWNNYDHRAIVEGLLLTVRPDRSISRVRPKTFMHRWWYRSVVDFRKAFLHFRYSPRMLAMVAMSLAMLFNFVIYFSSKFKEWSTYIESELSGGLCCDGEVCSRNDEYLWKKWTGNSTTVSLDSVRELLNIQYDNCETNKSITDALYYTLMLSSILMALMHVLSVFNLITVYRKHMMRFYKGDKKFLSKFEPGPYIALTDALKYASYQVIFVISGYIFSTVLVAMLFLFIAYTIILPAQDHYPDLFWPWIFNLFIYNSDAESLGMLSITLLLYAAMMAIVWYCFLDRNVYMAIQNRIFWDTFDLFQTIANFLVGFFMFIKRLLVQILFGILFISRLDKPLVPRGYEWIDPGFACYQGFLYVELYYSNPVMLTFIQLLVDSNQTGALGATLDDAEAQVNGGLRYRGARGWPEQAVDDVSLINEEGLFESKDDVRLHSVANMQRGGKKKNGAFKRWQLLLTLINNPQLQKDRRQRGSDMSDHKKHMASLRHSMYRSDSSQLDLGPGCSSSARASPDRPIRKTSGGGILKSVSEPGGNATGRSHSGRDRTLSDPDNLL